jgi:hypothetical protein
MQQIYGPVIWPAEVSDYSNATVTAVRKASCAWSTAHGRRDALVQPHEPIHSLASSAFTVIDNLDHTFTNFNT